MVTALDIHILAKIGYLCTMDTNQWFGVLSVGSLGYAQFPGGNQSIDGIVNGTWDNDTIC